MASIMTEIPETGSDNSMADLPVSVFLRLRRRLFDGEGRPVPFPLRDKRNTQDDPFDEFLATDVLDDLPGIRCVRASGPLITPDMVCYRPDRIAGATLNDFADDIDTIITIEVKKLERTARGGVARGSGLDYNTTPPCGRVRVYDAEGVAVDVRGFYLFVCLEPDAPGGVMASGLCLVDGSALNDDFDLYLSVTGERTKRLGLGTYGDGANRNRPMLIFANPLGAPEFDRTPVLIHPDGGLARTEPTMQLIHRLRRSVSGGRTRDFFCYSLHSDVSAAWEVTDLVDPFPTPSREERTIPRGRFKLPFRV